MAEQVKDVKVIRDRIEEKFRNVQRFGVIAKKSPDWVYKRLYYPTEKGLAELAELVEKTLKGPTSYELSGEDYHRIKSAVNAAVVKEKKTLHEWCKAHEIDHFWLTRRLFENRIRLKSSERLKRLLEVLEITL